jgi:hypothetical protein
MSCMFGSLSFDALAFAAITLTLVAVLTLAG